MRQKSWIIAVILLLLLVLTACGGQDAGTAEELEPEESGPSIEAQIAEAGQPVIEPEIPMEEWENADLYQEVDRGSTEKAVITLGTMMQYDETEWLVQQFNEASTDYVAELKYYDDLTILATEIVAGDGPDVLFLTDVPYARYMKSGAFLPLTDVLDGAEDYEPKLRELLSEQFGDQVLLASYQFNCIAAPASVLQGKTAWTFEEFKEIAAETNTFRKFTKNECLMLYCWKNLGEHINEQENTCSFDSEEFCEVLEFANQFLQDVSQMVDDGRGADIQLTMADYFISALDTTSYELDFWNGSPSTYLGFPSNSGAGVMAAPDLQLAVLASTEQEAGAKALVAYALSEEFQSFIASKDRFPVHESILRNQIMTTFTTGDYEEAPIADEMLAKLEDMWDRTTGISYVDEALREIVMEEAAAYFNGDKTAEEAARLIQNRAQLYLDEQG